MGTAATDTTTHCHSCGYHHLDEVPGFSDLLQVTSDCRPWKRGGFLGVCAKCGLIQKRHDDKWKSETTDIYRAYSVYHQSSGKEQQILNNSTGNLQPRSEVLLNQLSNHVDLKQTGAYLDIGCGNGQSLRSFHGKWPGWRLAGFELDNKHKADILAIDENAVFYSGELSQIKERFQLISLFHVLEHIPGPKQFLEENHFLLENDATLLIQVPNAALNPFDLLIADHISHFTSESLKSILLGSGHQPVALSDSWILKEISGICTKTENSTQPAITNPFEALTMLNRLVDWLLDFRNIAIQESQHNTFGIFGTSIAATWLAGELAEGISFFVDEDPARIGKTFMSRPVLSPQDVQQDAKVLLALPPIVAEKVKNKLDPKNEWLISPPDLP